MTQFYLVSANPYIIILSAIVVLNLPLINLRSAWLLKKYCSLFSVLTRILHPHEFNKRGTPLTRSSHLFFFFFFLKKIDFKLEIKSVICVFCASGLFRGCCLLQVFTVWLIICGATWTPQLGRSGPWSWPLISSFFLMFSKCLRCVRSDPSVSAGGAGFQTGSRRGVPPRKIIYRLQRTWCCDVRRTKVI